MLCELPSTLLAEESGFLAGGGRVQSGNVKGAIISGCISWRKRFKWSSWSDSRDAHRNWLIIGPVLIRPVNSCGLLPSEHLSSFTMNCLDHLNELSLFSPRDMQPQFGSIRFGLNSVFSPSIRIWQIPSIESLQSGRAYKPSKLNLWRPFMDSFRKFADGATETLASEAWYVSTTGPVSVDASLVVWHCSSLPTLLLLLLFM